MIRGKFVAQGNRRRPFIEGALRFEDFPGQQFELPLLVDTGADRTLLGPADVSRLLRRIKVRYRDLPSGPPGLGIGGSSMTRLLQASLFFGDYSTGTFGLTLLDPASSLTIPSLLGRDILSQFALYLEEHTGRLFLLDREEASRLNLPG